MLFLDAFDEIIEHFVEFILQILELFDFFTRISVDDVLYICPDDSLTLFMERTALVEVFRPNFTHKSGHSAFCVDAD